MAIPVAAAMIAAALISAAASGASSAYGSAQQKRAGERRAKELRRETMGGLFNDAAQRSADLESQRLQGNTKLGQRKSQSMMDTATLLREAFKI